MDGIKDIWFIKNVLIPILDIGIAAFIIYRVYIIISETRAMYVIKGLVFIVFASWLSRMLNLETVNWMFSGLLNVFWVVIIVLFQPEIRWALAKLGQNSLLAMFSRGESSPIIAEISDAVLNMAEHHIGALIVIEKKVRLKSYAEKGIKIDALVNSELIYSIFIPKSPLHDGAIIIEGNRIAAAKCFLPLSERTNIRGSKGTRHSAALGLSEESDALIIVVSEQTGQISIAYDGKLYSNINKQKIRQNINKYLSR